MAAQTPWPVMRTASTEHIDIRHPTPDLTILPEGAVSHNVARLEQSAEELSQGGSDIGDEIRKLQRQNIQQATHSITTRSRGASTSSYSNSIVDLNREARWGGYSPGGFIGSPAQSIHSGSWSQAVLHRSTSNAMSTSTRPEPVQEGRPLDSPLASPVAASATRQASHSSLSRSVSIQNSIQPSRRGSRSSKRSSVGSAESADSPKLSRKSGEFIDVGEEGSIKEGHGEELDKNTEELEDKENMPHYQQSHHDEEHPLPERPGSSDTYRQANILFQDFDGVHFSPTHEEFVEVDEYGNEIRRIPLEMAGQELLQHQELLTPRAHQVTFAHPPPPDHMVYYPAPVPRMLNLPKKLSSKPTPAMVAQRKSQVMMQAPKTNRKSTLQIGEFGFEREQRQSMVQLDERDEDEGQHSKPGSIRSASPTRQPHSPMRPGVQQRSSMATLSHMQQRASMATLSHIPANLPPQLRASLFFDAPAAAQNINIQSESAVATLDSILQASATAPVSVFTDHPFAGRIGGQVYAREERPRAKRNTMSTPLISDAKNSAKALTEANPKSPRRRSITGMLTGNDDADEKPKLARRNSVMSLLTDLGHSDGKKLQKRNSRMSLNSEDMLGNEPISRPISPARTAPLEHTDYQDFHDDQPEAEQLEEDDEEVPDEEVDPVYAQPTTLLAELQLRKAQQKTRNRTAATAFPNGMHSTLLQLDAVAQIEAKKRKNHKVALAWEDPSVHAKQNEEVDEDVPLAVLYPTKNGLRPKRPGESDWDRPIGLLEKRQLEDNEPLSSRRNRILGINPKAANRLAPSPSNLSSPHGHSAPASSRGEPSPAYAHSVNNQETQIDEDDLPLAERRRRIQQKAALDSALKDVVAKDNKSTFETDVLSVLIPQEAKDDAGKENSKPASSNEPEEETLGQRRARLQREALANPGATVDRPQVRNSVSLANLLSAVPLDPSRDRVDRDRRNASSPAPGTLLGNHDAKSREQKEKMRVRNARTSSYMDRSALPRPESNIDLSFAAGMMGGGMGGRRSSTTLLNMNLQPSASMPAGMNQAYVNGAANGAMGAQKLANGYHAQMAQMTASQGGMVNPLAFQSFVPPAPVTGMGFSGGMAAESYVHNPMMMNGQMGMGYMQGMNGMQMGMVGGMNGYGNMNMGMPMMNGYGNVNMPMGMPMGYGMQDPTLGMDPARRETIDRWRSSVAQ